MWASHQVHVGIPVIFIRLPGRIKEQLLLCVPRVSSYLGYTMFVTLIMPQFLLCADPNLCQI